jgi:hypothetical protein
MSKEEKESGKGRSVEILIDSAGRVFIVNMTGELLEIAHVLNPEDEDLKRRLQIYLSKKGHGEAAAEADGRELHRRDEEER